MSKTITIDRDFFEHVLNCLENQKFTYPDVNGIYVGKDSVIQEHIDATWKKGMDLLRSKKSVKGVCEKCGQPSHED